MRLLRDYFFAFVGGLVLFHAGSSVDAQCPTLPSGFCFVDCTRSVYRIVCENAIGRNLFKDIIMYNNTAQDFELYVWNSRQLTRLTSAIVEPIKNQLVRLELDNLVRLTHFPELTLATKLKVVTIMNSPLLTDLPAELIPQSLESLTLHRVGMTELVNDFEEVQELGNVTSFSFSQGNLSFIQNKYFTLFPNLKSIRLRNNVFTSQNEYGKVLTTTKGLDSVQVVQNNLTAVPYNMRRKIMQNAFGSLNMSVGSKLDWSDNHMPITVTAIRELKKLANVRYFSIANNKFEDYISLTNMFKGFDLLEYIDMSSTGLMKSKSMLSGLPSLKELRLSDNNFRDLTTVNLFYECNATNLQYLELSLNHLRVLPAGLGNISQNLRILNISHNDIDLAQISTYDPSRSAATFRDFPELRSLDLSFNHLADQGFNGSMLEQLTKLETLNISCNGFTDITKDFFDGLPYSIKLLNMSFCIKSESQAPNFRPHALSTLPPNIETFFLNQGYLKSSIFYAFVNASIPALINLDLSYNIITDIPSKEILYPLRNLKTLRMRYNLLQSVGPDGLSTLKALERLDLSRNEISSVGANDFGGLTNLKMISLSGNNIVDIDPGALEELPNLETFYFGKNRFGDVQPAFGATGGSKLRHLGLQYMPSPCVDSKLFKQLKHIRWIYINQSLPIYVDFGSFRNIIPKTIAFPPKPESFRATTIEERGCEAEYLTPMDDPDSSIRVLIQDKVNQVAQHILLAFPICHSPGDRNIRSLINIVCPPSYKWMSSTDGSFDLKKNDLSPAESEKVL
ncbi:putative Internalin-I [Hypsibius exemplaris]|uniref:Internalin-I n=1 Tax=Hypsibius exemplaris TaxID=2072580 RepID=A0A9X6RL33_HYPEX|nr:putative Internalin-I [Hypsibius exemplaris]